MSAYKQSNGSTSYVNGRLIDDAPQAPVFQNQGTFGGFRPKATTNTELLKLDYDPGYEMNEEAVQQARPSKYPTIFKPTPSEVEKQRYTEYIAGLTSDHVEAAQPRATKYMFSYDSKDEDIGPQSSAFKQHEIPRPSQVNASPSYTAAKKITQPMHRAPSSSTPERYAEQPPLTKQRLTTMKASPSPRSNELLAAKKITGPMSNRQTDQIHAEIINFRPSQIGSQNASLQKGVKITFDDLVGVHEKLPAGFSETAPIAAHHTKEQFEAEYVQKTAPNSNLTTDHRRTVASRPMAEKYEKDARSRSTSAPNKRFARDTSGSKHSIEKGSNRASYMAIHNHKVGGAEPVNEVQLPKKSEQKISLQETEPISHLHAKKSDLHVRLSNRSESLIHERSPSQSALHAPTPPHPASPQRQTAVQRPENLAQNSPLETHPLPPAAHHPSQSPAPLKQNSKKHVLNTINEVFQSDRSLNRSSKATQKPRIRDVEFETTNGISHFKLLENFPKDRPGERNHAFLRVVLRFLSQNRAQIRPQWCILNLTSERFILREQLPADNQWVFGVLPATQLDKSDIDFLVQKSDLTRRQKAQRSKSLQNSSRTGRRQLWPNSHKIPRQNRSKRRCKSV